MPFFYFMSTLQNINIAEQKWQELLYNHVKNIFKTTWLPSHDQWHSGRVWEFAKNLLLSLEKNNVFFSLQETEELMISSYFHDSGMSVTLEPEHGIHSRDICHRFLKDQASLTPDQKEKILDSVESHDDKSYRNEIFKNQDRLLPWLCIADDMDAFGNIGVYRFWEINTLRKIPYNQMHEKISQSLEHRINFLSLVYPYRDDFYNSQLKRNKTTLQFYKRMEKEIKESVNTKTTLFTMKIISFFRNLILTQKNRPENLFTLVHQETTEPEIIEFFKDFNAEVRFSTLN